MRLMYERIQPEAAPYGLLRCLRDQDLLHAVMVSTGHSETEERWLKARGCRSWLNHYTHVTDQWDNYWHHEALRLPVVMVALEFGYWPDDEAGATAGPGPAAAAGAYDDLLVEGDAPPMFGGDS
jgi:hypothetical protein